MLSEKQISEHELSPIPLIVMEFEQYLVEEGISLNILSEFPFISNCLRFKYIKFLHPSNICDISFAEFETKLDRSKDSNFRHP